MEKIRSYVKECLEGMDETVITTRKLVFFEILCGFLGGVILGMLAAPSRYVKVGCDNGNNCIGKDECCGCDCDCDCDREDD